MNRTAYKYIEGLGKEKLLAVAPLLLLMTTYLVFTVAVKIVVLKPRQ